MSKMSKISFFSWFSGITAPAQSHATGLSCIQTCFANCIWKNICNTQIINFNTHFWKVRQKISAWWIVSWVICYINIWLRPVKVLITLHAKGCNWNVHHIARFIQWSHRKQVCGIYIFHFQLLRGFLHAISSVSRRSSTSCRNSARHWSFALRWSSARHHNLSNHVHATVYPCIRPFFPFLRQRQNVLAETVKIFRVELHPHTPPLPIISQ